VNSYEDEAAMKVTLLEGSVHVTYTDGAQAMLKPGQQASVNGSSNIRVISDIDIMAVVAWKNDHFMMKGTDLGTLTRQMARWYDIEIFFERKIPDRKFGGSISRSVNLATMLKALKESGIESKLEGRTVTIK
jgi:transmembrane sensor